MITPPTIFIVHSFITSVSKISEIYLSNFFELKNMIVKKKIVNSL